jgi:MFS family permease
MSGATSPNESLATAAPLILAGFAISFVLIGGGIDTVGVFINAIVQSTDWARSALSLGVSVGAVTAAGATPLVGLAIDRFGVRVPIATGVLFLAGGFGILVQMQAPWHFVAANVLLGIGFAACALMPLTVAITVCVQQRTALALGIAGAGASVGALVLAPALQVLIESFGWRTTYVAMGTAVVVTPLPFLAFALPAGRLRVSAPGGSRDDPETNRDPAPPAESPWRRPGVARLTVVMILPALTMFAVSVHLVPYLTGCGFTGRAAATALGATIGISAVGKILGGAFADRIGVLRALRLALLLATAALALLPWATSMAALATFVFLYGLALGTDVAVIPPLARDVLGVQGFGASFGALQLASMLAAGAGPIAAGVLFDATGGYTEAIGLWVGAMLCALAVALTMRGGRPEPIPAPI